MATNTNSSRDIIHVPDLDAAALTTFAKEQCKLTYLDSRYERWNYLIGLDKQPISGRNQRFEVLVWKPGREVSSDAVYRYFQGKGFSGHVAAFTAWVAEHSPDGYHASIPENSACWCGYGGNLYVPYACFDGICRELRRYWIGSGWSGSWSFVAFRELPA